MSLLLMLTQATGPTEPTGPVVRNVVTGGRQMPGAGTAGEYATTRNLTLQADATEVRLMYGQVPATATGPAIYDATINGIPVTFDGQAAGTCEPGQWITSDYVTINGLAGDTLTIVSHATGPAIPSNPTAQGGIGPFRVEAPSTIPSTVIIGSSTGANPKFDEGFDAGGMPTVNMSQGGSRPGDYTEAKLDSFGLNIPTHGYTHAFIQVGTNASGQGAAAMCQGVVDLAWQLKARGIPNIVQMVWKPQTDSTDGWATIEGQTPRHADRVQAVAWLRAGAPVSADGRTWDPTMGTVPGALYVGQPGHPFAGIVDWGGEVEAAENGELFRVDHGPITFDGLHLYDTGYDLANPVITAWAQQTVAAWP